VELKAEIGLISIAGRGHWLAAALAQSGVPVTLLDVSHQMGAWEPEDLEGPFGYFQLEGLEAERLTSDVQSLEVAHGLTLWLPDGPVEFRGPTTEYRLEKAEIPAVVRDYVSGDRKMQDLRAVTFQHSWLAHLAHHLSSSVATLAPESIREGLRQNFFARFHVRVPTANSLEASLKWCESKGVKVLRHVEIKDIAFEEGRNLTSLEIRTDKPGLFQAEQFVLCLTAEECGMLSSKIQNELFANRVQEPEWAWMRYRVKFQGGGELATATRDQVPQACVLIGDLMLPWSHENLLILHRAPMKDHFDAWVKIPHSQRFHSQYLSECGARMKLLLESKVPENVVSIESLPIEAHSTFQKVGPARHPIFSRALRAMRQQAHLQNIYMDSPEYWKSLSWEGQIDHQKTILKNLQNWWQRREELRIKREAKEAAKLKKRGAEL
jgi:hypothetical protein